MTDRAPPRFDADALRDLAGDSIFARGEAYLRDGRVQLLAVDQDRVLAKVSGSEPYRVELTGHGPDIDGTCSCPAFEDRGFCKHLVAAALATGAQEPAGGNTPDRIRRHLRSKGVDALVELILEQARRDPDLFRSLDMAAAAACDEDDVLEARFLAAIDDAILSDYYIGYREVRAWADEVEAVLDRIAGLVDDGRAASALRLAEHAMARIEDMMRSVDGSDGRYGGLQLQARDIHLHACRAARPDPVALAHDLFAREVEDGQDAFHAAAVRYADVLGEEGLSEYRRLAEAAWKTFPPLAAGDKDGGYGNRYRLSRILDFFAEREGDVDARIAIRARDLSSPFRYLELAEFCQSQGRGEEALRWAEEGLWAFEDTVLDERLTVFTVGLLFDAGRGDEAEALARRLFERQPSLESYRLLRRLGGEAARDRAVAALRTRLDGAGPRSAWHFPADLLIRVLMEEAAYADAWTVARQHGASKGLEDALAEASEGSHPREALAVYAARIDELVSAGGSRNYQQASQLIDRMSRLREASEQAAHIAALRARFKAKRNFIKLLDS